MSIFYLLLFGFMIVFLYIFFLVVSSLVVERKEYDTNSQFYRFLLNSSTAIALKAMRIKVHISGMEIVPENKKLLFVSNHRSKFDPIVTWYVFREWQPAFISKMENFRVPIFGRFIRKCCFMAIDRENPREAMKTVNHAAELLQKDEVSVGVYPEGTRSKSGELLPFHNGVLKIAQKANVPIVVLAVSGTEQIAKNYPFHKSDVYLDVVEVIPADDACKTRSRDLGEQIRSGLEVKLNERRKMKNE